VVHVSILSRRAALIAEVRGRVLDLGDPAPHLAGYASAGVAQVTAVGIEPGRADDLQREADGLGVAVDVHDELGDAVDGGPFDDVVSVLGLPRFADLATTIATVVAASPDATLRVIEPVQRPGALSTAVAPVAARLPALIGTHLNRDVPSAVRACGLTIVSIERFTMPTLLWPLRSFAQVVAWRIEPTDGDHAP
jgi:hypothetical protein